MVALMDITLAYAIVLGSCLGIMVLLRPVRRFASVICPTSPELRHLPPLPQIIRYLSQWTAKHLTFQAVLRQGKYIDRWSRADIVLTMMYLGANMTCVLVYFPGMTQAGFRAGRLSIINTILLFAGPHLSFVADMLGVSIRTCRRLHVLAGLVAILLAVFHAIVGAATKGTFSLQTPRNLWALIVGLLSLDLCRDQANRYREAILSFCVQLIPLALRHLSYEIALRIHQLLSFVFAYAVWRHIPSVGLFPRLYLYIASGIFLRAVALQLGHVCYRNKLGLCRARISYDLNTIKVRLHLRRPLKLDAGHLSEYGPTTSIVLFSGPHGQPWRTDGYENILLIATGFGIAAHLPCLRKLIYDYHTRTVPLRRIHLVWQIDDLDIGIAAQQLLNKALAEDSLDGDYVCLPLYLLHSRLC
ncbi:Ferric reductase like transmembrane component [Aspergillus parasiticus SU-1]|uniref:Ferric reductase like transmembrane component n=1 Tax=Aspergillus parasiticus (strain ATCC 56775 / NRRL 5862 / SRRC 143 / SU-1) TaxID=1403190 RepID=A0A0F0IK76_ASPPU|nr:Ferric reductase like transmembrane component [Aspergillus parasiticus SU-1]